MSLEIRRGPFTLSTDRARVDVGVVHDFLRRSYWAANIPESVVRRSLQGSLCFGIYEDLRQVAFGRVVTDYATFAWIADVFVLEPWRGRGLARWLVESMLAHEDLAGIRRWILATKDAHGVYRGCGFRPLAAPDRFMEVLQQDPYAPGGAGIGTGPPDAPERDENDGGGRGGRDARG